MVIELKHLAPYLPYGLEMLSEDKIHVLTVATFSYRLHDSMPILHPLSDLTKDSNLFKDYDVFIPPANYLDVQCHNYDVAERLFKNHFDVFGLIDSGLAIDINTLEK